MIAVHAVPVKRLDQASWRSYRHKRDEGIPIRTAREVVEGHTREAAIALLHERIEEVRACMHRLESNAHPDCVEEYQQQRTRMQNIIVRLRNEVERINTMRSV